MTKVHRVRAVNTAPDSENKIHDDTVAAQYGFRGGLVPGVTVYGYMTVPVVELLPEWRERGVMQVRFLEPVYDGDQVVARAVVSDDGSVQVTAEREDGTICAKGVAAMRTSTEVPGLLPEHALPNPDARPVPAPDTVVPGAALGTVSEKLDLSNRPQTAALLQFSNEILVRNFRLGPWIHTSSEITNWGAVEHGAEIRASGRLHDRFERKGHEFIVVDLTLAADGGRLVQTVRHTAIYRPKPRN